VLILIELDTRGKFEEELVAPRARQRAPLRDREAAGPNESILAGKPHL